MCADQRNAVRTGFLNFNSDSSNVLFASSLMYSNMGCLPFMWNHWLENQMVRSIPFRTFPNYGPLVAVINFSSSFQSSQCSWIIFEPFIYSVKPKSVMKCLRAKFPTAWFVEMASTHMLFRQLSFRAAFGKEAENIIILVQFAVKLKQKLTSADVIRDVMQHCNLRLRRTLAIIMYAFI